VIDPRTREVVQTVYIRRVERVNGQLYNSEFEKFADVKDPGEWYVSFERWRH
jgi:branched-chain amino acid transport system substrate-binding protein